MEKRDQVSQVKLINQALNAAVSSVNLARQLLSELVGEKDGIIHSASRQVGSPAKNSGPMVRNLPGIIGVFDGRFMTGADGQKFQVPENYASKSMIVFGDRLKMVDLDGEARFKQIERVKRQRASGIIVKKEGRLTVVTSDGSYRVLPAAVSFFGGQEGDEAKILIPLNNKNAPFAAIEAVTGGKKEISVSESEKKVEVREIKSVPVLSGPAEPGEKVKKVEKRKETKKILPPPENQGELPALGKEKSSKREKVAVAEKGSGPLIGEDELR